MANEVSWANLETDAGLAAYVDATLHEKLYDPTDLRATMTRRDFRAGMNSDSVKTTTVQPAHPFTAASSEISGGAANESLGSGNFVLAIARYLQKWTLTDLWRITDGNRVNIDLLIQWIVEATGLTMTDIVAALFPALSQTAGSTTAQMSVDFMYDAQYKLHTSLNPAGEYHLVLAPHCFNKWQDSLRGEGGAVQFVAETREMLVAGGPGRRGRFGNITIWSTDSVTLDGGSTFRRNAMYTPGAFGFCEAPVPDVADALPPNVKAIIDGLVRVVRDFDAANGMTLVYGDYYPAAVEQEDARGVLISALAA